MEINESLKRRLREESPELEEKVNKVLLESLAKSMIKEEVPHAYAEGYRQALMLRLNLKKLTNIKE